MLAADNRLITLIVAVVTYRVNLQYLKLFIHNVKRNELAMMSAFCRRNRCVERSAMRCYV